MSNYQSLFFDGKVEAGEMGIFIGPWGGLSNEDRWYIVKAKNRFVPVLLSQIKKADI
jgi:hypothetical protein